MNQGHQPGRQRAACESGLLVIPTTGTVSFAAPMTRINSVEVMLVCVAEDDDHGYRVGDEIPTDLGHARNSSATTERFLSWYRRGRTVVVVRNAGNWNLYKAAGGSFVTGVASAPGANQFLTSNFAIRVRCA